MEHSCFTSCVCSSKPALYLRIGVVTLREAGAFWTILKAWLGALRKINWAALGGTWEGTLLDEAKRPILQDLASHRSSQAENWNKRLPLWLLFPATSKLPFLHAKVPWNNKSLFFQQGSSANRKEAKAKAWEMRGLNQQAWGQFEIWQSCVLKS